MEKPEIDIRKEFAQITSNRFFCYPAEPITYQISFRAEKTKGHLLQVIWPGVVEIEKVHLPEGIPENLPSVAQEDDYLYLLIALGEGFKAGQEYQFEVETRINTYYIDQHLHAEVQLVSQDGARLAGETTRLAVFGRSKMFKYLPEIYNGNEFLSRFLMLFESFWQPVEQQTRQMHNYFDPRYTPEEFLPWLASWMGVPIDDFLPLERTRELLKSALQIYQLRGTVGSLQQFLEIFSASQVEIIEQRASNFTLGETNYLGAARALGHENQPTSIIVKLEVPKSELDRTGFSRKQYQNKIEDVVHSMVPAHISYKVQVIFVS